MKISDRFTDYGLIGGLFWVFQFIIWFVWSGIPALKVFDTFVADFGRISGSAATLTAAVGVIAVFSTGLLLDVVGAFAFRSYEMLLFKRNLDDNERWLKPFLDANQAYVQKDLERISQEYTKKTPELPLTGLWRRKKRTLFLKLIQNRVNIRRAYLEMDSFLQAYVAMATGADKVELLNRQVALQNSARTIAAALMLSGCELSAFFFRANYHSEFATAALAMISMFILIAIAFAVAMAAYQRLCYTLFALAYVIAARDQAKSFPMTDVSATLGASAQEIANPC